MCDSLLLSGRRRDRVFEGPLVGRGFEAVLERRLKDCLTRTFAYAERHPRPTHRTKVLARLGGILVDDEASHCIHKGSVISPAIEMSVGKQAMSRPCMSFGPTTSNDVFRIQIKQSPLAEVVVHEDTNEDLQKYI
jgi:hypothetical protein